MLMVERKIVDFIERHWLVLSFIAITILALMARYAVRNTVSLDYIHFLEPWYNTLKANGGLSALANFPGDYNAPYMTILALMTYTPLSPIIAIKLISIAFDFALAISAVLLVRQIKGKEARLLSLMTYAAVLFLPTVLMNGAGWGQCDSIYATFAVLAILFLLKEKYVKSFILLGVAIAFKLQAVFILPVFVILYFCKKKFSVLHFLIIPATDFVLCLPAIMEGWPIKKVLTTYIHQTQTYSDTLVSGFPNIFAIMSGDPSLWSKCGIVMTMAILCIILIASIRRKVNWDAEKVLGLSILVLVAVTFFLPYMHERYLFVGEILMLVYFIIYRKNWLLTLTVLITPIITYSIFLFGLNWDLKVISVIYGSLVLYGIRGLVHEALA